MTTSLLLNIIYYLLFIINLFLFYFRLCVIHEKNFIHRGFHSGNILLSESSSYQHWQIGDLGLSQPANSDRNNEIYGIIPNIAPEILKVLLEGAVFSKESDIYSMGMIMWE